MEEAATTARAARTAGAIDWEPVEHEALELFRALLRIDTTNPPGNERPAAELLAQGFREDGIEPVIVESAPGRASVVARLKGTGAKPPLLLSAHLDVVTADPAEWEHPPFAGEIHDGYVWGRGAVDMKHMAAMGAMVLRLLKREGVRLERDVIFAGVADEEAGSHLGAGYLVRELPELVRAEYALGEIGGFSLRLGRVTYYPIQIAEKGTVWGRLRARGESGHGSIPRPDNAVVQLARAVSRLGSTRLPQHTSEPVRAMVEALASAQRFPLSVVLRGLLNPQLSSTLLRAFPKPSVARAFAALLSNTASPTVLRAGTKTNVIPSEAVCEFDGRTVPGQGEEDLLRELRAVVGPEVEIEVFDTTPPVVMPQDTELYASLAQSVRDFDPEGVPVPYVIPGFTDARAYAALGTKYYGFAPLRFDPAHDVAFADLYHGKNERAPVDGFKWGLRLLHHAVRRFCA